MGKIPAIAAILIATLGGCQPQRMASGYARDAHNDKNETELDRDEARCANTAMAATGRGLAGLYDVAFQNCMRSQGWILVERTPLPR